MSAPVFDPAALPSPPEIWKRTRALEALWAFTPYWSEREHVLLEGGDGPAEAAEPTPEAIDGSNG